jgi:hypothetical protein
MSLLRNPIGLITLGIFASVSAFGQGLHLLPSANHFSAPAHACAHCRHHHHHGAAPTTDSDAKLAHDCPICRFLAQAQFRTDVHIELPFTHSCEMFNDRQPVRMALPLVALHLARAPPLVGQCCNG